MRVAICGGGTGGHLYPLLALDRELDARGAGETHFFISEKIGLGEAFENKRLTTAELHGFHRRFQLQALVNLTAVLKAARASLAFRRVMRRERPDVAVGFGSYASAPGVLAAASLRVPVLVHEQNAVPGLTNRLLGRLARGVAVSFPRSGGCFRCREVRVVGNPVREELLRPADRSEALRFFDLQEGVFTVSLVGGSQGSESLNRALAGALPRFGEDRPVQVIQAAGKEKYRAAVEAVEKAGPGAGVTWRPYPYVERMDLLYACTDLLISRSGASTLSEITALGLPALLVPFPRAARNHQEANARVLVERGAALCVQDHELTGEKLFTEIEALMRDERRLEETGRRAREMGILDSAARLADFAEELAGG